MKAIVGLEIEITKLEGKFKFNQNRPKEDQEGVIEHLDEGTKGWIVWDKAQHGLTMSDCELAYSSFHKPTRIFTQNRCILMQEGGTIHPTQKPVKLYEWLLSNYAKEGDSILDTHMGSGSIAIATNKLGFDLTACELDEEYFAQACDRIEKEQIKVDTADNLKKFFK